jgi:hypothetical protein
MLKDEIMVLLNFLSILLVLIGLELMLMGFLATNLLVISAGFIFLTVGAMLEPGFRGEG